MPFFQIEKNVPIPSKEKGSRAGKWLNIVRTMESGDSFLVKTEGQAASVRIACKSLNRRAIQRKEGDGAIRIWCVERPLGDVSSEEIYNKIKRC